MMKKTILTLLTCLSFNSLSAEFLDREWQLTVFLEQMSDISQDQCLFIEKILPEDYIRSGTWNYHRGKMDAYDDVLQWLTFFQVLDATHD
jgi:hypothetical protein